MLAQIVSKKFDIPNAHTLDVALAHGAYSALEEALKKTPQTLRDIIKESNLRGKGGGGAPAGKKWELAAKQPSSTNRRYLIVNADESEPGTFKDRQILAKDPHLLIEGVILTAYAIGAQSAYIYVRGEYEEFINILQNAVDEAYKSGYLGSEKYGNIDLVVHRGAGAYICGEKSALIESLEGNRGHPRLKPHQPESEFFFGDPALVNNVETIASVPFILENGADAYRAYGTEKSSGTLLFALSGHINNPGVYECAFGGSMLEFIEDIGGGVKNGKRLKAVIPGGASTPVIPAHLIKDVKMDYESLRSFDSALGTGGMIIMDEDTDMVKALKNLLHFYHHESCGQCTPCREGTSWADRVMQKFVDKRATLEDLEILRSVSRTMNGKTICVFAPACSDVIDGFLRHFEDEFIACIQEESC